MVIARYRAAAALIGDAQRVLEVGSGEGIGARILAKGREYYCGIDNDSEATQYARANIHGDDQTSIEFLDEDALTFPGLWNHDAAVALDVIEHIPVEREALFMTALLKGMRPFGVAVIGTPSKHAAHLASPQSVAAHVNLYTPERLKDVMGRYFHVVQMLYLQDVSIHLGHPGMAHYLLAVGIGPR
jgi:2-polyprenyl-3-methyl-5-hydroxy-6-metoxy-1,4-benzoquinol methylase